MTDLVALERNVADPVAQRNFDRLVALLGGPGGLVARGADGEPLYIQEATPVDTGTYLWVELNPDDTVKTVWVNVAP